MDLAGLARCPVSAPARSHAFRPWTTAQTSSFLSGPTSRVLRVPFAQSRRCRSPRARASPTRVAFLEQARVKVVIEAARLLRASSYESRHALPDDGSPEPSLGRKLVIDAQQEIQSATVRLTRQAKLSRHHGESIARFGDEFLPACVRAQTHSRSRHFRRRSDSEPICVDGGDRGTFQLPRLPLETVPRPLTQTSRRWP